MEKERVDLDTSTPRKRFPKWTRYEQDVWQDLFMDYTGHLMDFRLDRESIIEKMTGFKQDIEDAATLADHAMLEIQYRFFIQQDRPIRKQAKRRR